MGPYIETICDTNEQLHMGIGVKFVYFYWPVLREWGQSNCTI